MTDHAPYTPSEAHFRDYYVGGRSEYDPDDPGDDASREDWDRFLARVRRAAKAEALREAVEKCAITTPDALGYKVPAVTVEDLLDTADEHETGDQL